MSYVRVIPRDLFNEANFLKCLGALYIALETAGAHHASLMFEPFDASADFGVTQNGDGALYSTSIEFIVRGTPYHLTRPLNSRASWPLYCSDLDNDDFEPVAVFDEATGKLSADFLALIKA